MAIIYRLKVSEYIKNIQDIENSIVVGVKKGSDKRLVLYFYPNIYDQNVKKDLGEEKVKNIMHEVGLLAEHLISIHKTNKARGKFKYYFYAQTLEGDEMEVAKKCLQVYNNKPSRRVKLGELIQKDSSKFSLKSAIRKKFHKDKK